MIIGEDAVDFEVILEALDPAAGTAAILVRHTPPERPAIRIPAAWMRAPVAGTANNWVEVQRLEGGRYAARIGQETFDDRLTVDLNDGKILRAELQNPVNAIERTCEEAALARCSAAAPLRIMRTVTLTLVR